MEPAIHSRDPVHINRRILPSRASEPGEVAELRSADKDVPLLARVLAEPGDAVAQHGADFVINDATLSRERIRLRCEGSDTNPGPAFRQRLGECSFTAEYGPLFAPTLPVVARLLPENVYLPAYDTRVDETKACGLFPRNRMTGLADWNARTSARA
jgi:hypothetical protein